MPVFQLGKTYLGVC